MREQPTIYSRLASICAQRGVTRDALAETLQVTPQLIGYIELGRYTPDLALALRISDFFGLHPDEIFSLRPWGPPKDVLV